MPSLARELGEQPAGSRPGRRRRGPAVGSSRIRSRGSTPIARAIPTLALAARKLVRVARRAARAAGRPAPATATDLGLDLAARSRPGRGAAPGSVIVVEHREVRVQALGRVLEHDLDSGRRAGWRTTRAGAARRRCPRREHAAGRPLRSTRRARSRASVDLPQPDSPTRPRLSPAPITDDRRRRPRAAVRRRGRCRPVRAWRSPLASSSARRASPPRPAGASRRTACAVASTVVGNGSVSQRAAFARSAAAAEAAGRQVVPAQVGQARPGDRGSRSSTTLARPGVAAGEARAVGGGRRAAGSAAAWPRRPRGRRA